MRLGVGRTYSRLNQFSTVTGLKNKHGCVRVLGETRCECQTGKTSTNYNKVIGISNGAVVCVTS